MIAVDANVLLRYVTNDDLEQGRRAITLLADPSGIFIAKTVLLELEWVLRSAFRLPRAAVEHALLTVLGLPNVTAENEAQIALALEYYRQGLDFADALHYVSSPPAASFHTFDAIFAKRGHKLGLKVHDATIAA